MSFLAHGDPLFSSVPVCCQSWKGLFVTQRSPQGQWKVASNGSQSWHLLVLTDRHILLHALLHEVPPRSFLSSTFWRSSSGSIFSFTVLGSGITKLLLAPCVEARAPALLPRGHGEIFWDWAEDTRCVSVRWRPQLSAQISSAQLLFTRGSAAIKAAIRWRCCSRRGHPSVQMSTP